MIDLNDTYKGAKRNLLEKHTGETSKGNLKIYTYRSFIKLLVDVLELLFLLQFRNAKFS
jgi:hypothetical protein